MAPFVSRSTSRVAWFSFLSLYLSFMDNSVIASVVAASEPSSLDREAQALLESGWWSGYTDYSPSRCEWPGISCNGYGSIVEISLPPQFQLGDKFGKFNFSAFPNLVSLRLVGHGLVGNIPSEIGTLHKLTHLDLSLNEINGSIPEGIWNLKNLETLNLARNRLIGSLPSSLGHLTNLILLDLSHNKMSGTFFSELTQLTQLEYLNLSSNQLSGKLPLEIDKLSKLQILDLSWNGLRGIIPDNLASCLKLKSLILSHNFLTGKIPSQIGYLFSLTSIDLSHNSFRGRIPSQLGNITNSRDLNLSHNKLTGTIPHSLIFLRRLDLSYNHLEGQIPNDFLSNFPPDAFLGNKDLFSDAFGFPLISSPSTSPSYSRIILNKKVFLPVIIFFALFFMGYLALRKVRKVREARKTKNGDLFSIWNYDGKIAFKDIIKATEDFDIKYCIGSGKFGSVYKAQLPSGRVVALKKLNSLEAEEPDFLKSFKNEVRILSKIRHRNIVKLHGFCFYRQCMFLVYEYMERGSLFSLLRNDNEAKQLGWFKRINIIEGIAHALSYMHHDCSPPIVHRDVTSSNILLNMEMKASVSDFGIARLLYPNSSNQTVLAGTFGYVAPVLEWWP